MIQFIKKYGKWVILGILLFIFAIIAHELLSASLINFDTTIYHSIISIKSSFWTFFFTFITSFASPIVIIIISLSLFVMFKNKKYAWLSLGSLGLIFLINTALKYIFSRPRPFEWMLVEETGYSFPSAHAMIAMAFYGLLIYLIWQTQIDKNKKIFLTVIMVTLIILIGISRIYLGVHYCTDIIGGFTLSLSYLIIVTSIIDYYWNRNKQ